ncbi:T5orf172 domain-containing protein [Xylogone sp. PMI_703]|nr:T5orf172 domain-containing protein [Xylogone sp. PMI_703]
MPTMYITDSESPLNNTNGTAGGIPTPPSLISDRTVSNKKAGTSRLNKVIGSPLEKHTRNKDSDISVEVIVISDDDLDQTHTPSYQRYPSIHLSKRFQGLSIENSQNRSRDTSIPTRHTKNRCTSSNGSQTGRPLHPDDVFDDREVDDITNKYGGISLGDNEVAETDLPTRSTTMSTPNARAKPLLKHQKGKIQVYSSAETDSEQEERESSRPVSSRSPSSSRKANPRKSTSTIASAPIILINSDTDDYVPRHATPPPNLAPGAYIDTPHRVILSEASSVANPSTKLKARARAGRRSSNITGGDSIGLSVKPTRKRSLSLPDQSAQETTSESSSIENKGQNKISEENATGSPQPQQQPSIPADISSSEADEISLDWIDYNATKKGDPGEVNIGIIDYLRGFRRSAKKSAAHKGSSNGYIYIFTSDMAEGHCKIGITANSVCKRINQWSQCSSSTTEAIDNEKKPFNHNNIVENLIQRELWDERRKFICSKCKNPKTHKPVAHGEWFCIDKKRALEITQRWRRWVCTKPFEDNMVLGDRWDWKLRMAEKDPRKIDWDQWVQFTPSDDALYTQANTVIFTRDVWKGFLKFPKISLSIIAGVCAALMLLYFMGYLMYTLLIFTAVFSMMMVGFRVYTT